MTYKKKIIILSGIISALAVVYILTIIFDPQRMGSRSDMYRWIETSQIPLISGIHIVDTLAEEPVSLVRDRGAWFVSRDGVHYPARQNRVEDLIETLAMRAPYPVRSASVSSHERYALLEGYSPRIVVTGGAGLLILDLMLGNTDASGRNIYLRKQGQNEVRSGDDRFSAYASSSVTSWYMLRLFPEVEDGALDSSLVQSFSVYHPPDNEDQISVQPMTFTRSGREWDFNFELNDPDMRLADSYIRDILNTTGDDFIDYMRPDDPLFDHSRIVIEFGNGLTREIGVSPPDEEGRHFAVVKDANWVYSLPAWTHMRLFAFPEYFER